MEKSEVRKLFFLKLFEALTRRIRAKVVIFEVFIIIMVAFSLGFIFALYLEKTLLQKADLFCERILKDLAKSIEYNYISISAADEAVKSFENTRGIMYIGYNGYIMAGDELKKVNLYAGKELSKEMLKEIDQRVKDYNDFAKNTNLLVVETEVNKFDRVFEYSMPVFVKIGEKAKRIGNVILWYSEKVITDEINMIKILVIFVTIIVTLFAIFLSIKGSDSIVNPIMQLTEAVKKFGRGEMNIKVRIPTKDEIGILAKAFDEMMVSVKEKLEMQKFVSTSTIKMIQKSVSSEVVSVMKDRPSERTTVTMLFSDIRGFTSISEKLDPQDVVDMLNKYLDIQTNIIYEFGGDIDKFVGDEIVAVFDGNEMYVNAVRAACEIQRRLIELNKERKDSGLPEVSVGIGINAGEVVRGSIGSRDRMDYTVIGDSVNLASRLCSIAEKNEIIVSRIIYENIGNSLVDVKFLPLEPIQVKGKSRPVEVYRVEY